MAIKLTKRLPANKNSVSVTTRVAKPQAVATAGAALSKPPPRSSAKPVRQTSATTSSDIFAALRTARANLLEGDLSLERARKILG